jgi:hypothetical protein
MVVFYADSEIRSLRRLYKMHETTVRRGYATLVNVQWHAGPTRLRSNSTEGGTSTASEETRLSSRPDLTSIVWAPRGTVVANLRDV